MTRKDFVVLSSSSSSPSPAQAVPTPDCKLERLAPNSSFVSSCRLEFRQGFAIPATPMASTDEIREPLLPSVQYPAVQYGNSSELSSTFRPLSSSQEGEGQLSEWAAGQYASSGASDIPPSVPPIETASLATVNEIREAAAGSKDPYPLWIYGALVTPDVSNRSSHEQPPQVPQSSAVQGSQQNGAETSSEQSVTEEEVRELLTDYVGKQGCWGGRSADQWPISKIEDCNVYIGTLETFMEERDVETRLKSYHGGPVDDQAGGHAPGPWEIDMRHEFPLLFTPRKRARLKMPASESVQACEDCAGRKEVACPSCNPNKNVSSAVSGVTTECSRCHGRGLLAHQDGSDTNCGQCHGKGKLLCTTCESRGRILCSKCQGSGALLEGKQLNVTWTTLKTKKISASSHATLVPDEVFHAAHGVQLYGSEAYQCQPVSFPESPVLTRLSSEVVAERVPVPPTARVICERHLVHMIPVTRVLVEQGHRRRAFKFFVVGLEKRVYLREYPDKCCWGLCGLGSGLCTIL